MIVMVVYFLLAYITFKIYKFYTYPHPKFPRGYIGFPPLGFLIHFLIQKNYSQKLLEIKNKYGKICSVQMGSFKCVWLNGPEVIREAWGNPAFSGRPLIPGILDRSFGKRSGIIFNDGVSFLEQHKFTVKTLKEFGFGRPEMESLILDEALELAKSLRETNGEAISTRHRFNVASLNAFWTIISGQRYSHGDPALTKLTHILDKNMELNDGAKAAFFMPWLAHYFPHLSGWTAYIAEAQEIFSFWQEFARIEIAKYKRNPTEQTANSSTNFVDAYIQEVFETKDSQSSFFQEIGENSLATTLQDLFVAGTETTATTLCWFFLYLAAFPNVQLLVIKEIDRVIGHRSSKNLPKLSDRARMPFLEATILETMRFGTLAPLGMLHRTVQDTHFHGYFIPENTIVMSNVSAVHMDADLWGDPENFRPQRFLSTSRSTETSGSEYIADEYKLDLSARYFLPFGHGKRKCIGEFMAKDELFLFVSTIMQEFRVRIQTDQVQQVSLEPKVGVSSIPPDHKYVFEPRNASPSSL